MATPGSQWLIENFATLPEKEWCAATNDGTVANNADLNLLINAVTTLDYDLSQVTIMYVLREKAV